MKKIILVAGARPNFMKIAPLIKELRRHKKEFEFKLVHTGQHYDFEMSGAFFQDLKIPNPDIHLEVGSATHAVQTAGIMIAFEKVILREKPDLIIVVGDVNSSLGCSLVASKLGVQVAHVEAGLRSFDRAMPEEINRIITDSLSDYLFVTEESGCTNLKREGVSRAKTYFVGNTMIDTLLSNMPKINRSKILTTHNLKPKTYCVLTLHRPSNVDSKKSLLEIHDLLKSLAEKIKIIYPIHPRTKKMITAHNLVSEFEKLHNLILCQPLGYIDFIKLVKESRFVLTDSGGIQEETSFLKVPCLTMRENTERPVTLKKGTNILVGRNKAKALRAIDNLLGHNTKDSQVPRLWDGRTAQRIVKILKKK
ncbi:MAG: UDP-N-acetylglucosamine 2-epimerase (non-hydrolyzing) [Candidatus Omnitrophota bacterium]